VFNILSGDKVDFVSEFSATGGSKLLLDGGGTVQFTGAKNLVANMEVTNGTIIAQGDESLGLSTGTTTFHMTSSYVKGGLVIKPEEGKDTVSFHRPVTFHYWVTGEHGAWLYFPANTTVNFYGLMSTSVSPLKSGCNPWPCHWNMSCPSTTVVNWYGGMYAVLDHNFSGGTHHIWKALTGGDRFKVGSTAKVYLHETGNRIGWSTGGVSGEVKCLAPYALDSRSVNQVMIISSGSAVVDLGGFDQALSIFGCNSGYSNAKVTSASPARLHITGGYTIDNTPSISMTNFVQFVGGAGISRDCSIASHALVLRNTSSSTGSVQVTSGLLKLAAPDSSGNWAGKWPNASAAIVTGGRLVLEHKAVFGTNTVMRISGSGKVEIPAGVRVKMPSLELDGVMQTIPGTYGSSESGAMFQNDTHFVGKGVLRVGRIGSCVILR